MKRRPLKTRRNGTAVRDWSLRNGYGSFHERLWLLRAGKEASGRHASLKTKGNGTACGKGAFSTVMVHFMNGYGSYEREKKRRALGAFVRKAEDKEKWHCVLEQF